MAKRISHEVDYRIYGGDLQLVEVELDPGEAVRAEVGAMAYMSQGIVMDTGTGGGVFSGLKRMFTGESFFITTFTHQGQGKAHVGFAAPFPGQIVPVDLATFGGNMLAQKDSFLCAAYGIDVEVAFTRRFGAGLFGSEGFILQRLTGDGMAFLHAGGTIVRKELAPGEEMRVDTGCLVAMAGGVDYSVEMQTGVLNAMFGGEGLFMVMLRGPGTVFLQSLPFSRLSDRIAASVARTINKDRG